MMHGGNVWRGGGPEKWLDFSANLRPEGPPDWVAEALRAALSDARYYPDPEMTAAQSGIAQYAGVPTECVLPASGGIAAIDALIRSAGRRVVVNPPTFSEYALRARAAGLDVSQAGFGAMCAGDLVFLCNPNNPTGGALTRDEVLALYDRARAVGALLAVDEAFIDFCPERSVRDQAARLEGLYVTGSLTKALAVPGVRLGYLVARPEAVRAVGRALPAWSLGAFAAAVAKRLPEHLSALAADRAENAARRGRFYAALAALGIRIAPSEANFLLCDFGRAAGPLRVRLEAEGILTRGCASFGLSDRFLRLAVRTDEENARLLDALRRQRCAGY